VILAWNLFSLPYLEIDSYRLDKKSLASFSGYNFEILKLF